MEVAVKSFGRQTFLKDLLDRRRGSKARRTWLAACALERAQVGTPPPIGYLDRWQGWRLTESYYLSAYRGGLVSFRDELIELFRREPMCEKFLGLLAAVATAVRAMHAGGFVHNDLGNQNILLRRVDEAAWDNVQFIDLNRARFGRRPGIRQRARDLSRIYLPSDLLRVFKEMYWEKDPPPSAFQRWEGFFRRAYAVHAGTRALRHPCRTFRSRRGAPAAAAAYPAVKDMWIWDERSGQPIHPLRSADRWPHYGRLRALRMAGAVLAAWAPLRREYRALLASAYRAKVPLRDRVGVAVEPSAGQIERRLDLLRKLGRVPVLVRFYCHKGEADRSCALETVRELHQRGHRVAIALVQDRRSVRQPERWDGFVEDVLTRTAGLTDWVEVGHAINRSKWGLWGFAEHARLLQGAARLSERFPEARFMGPAVIDFDVPHTLRALKNVPDRMRLQALSHHLYVDRRAAPENRQGMFSTLEKLALDRAAARWAPGCEDRLIISEVNWPLAGTGVYSPVGAPYESPGPRFGDPSVREEECADYLIRYLLIAVCSGLAERVYWWRLAARGYGLVDDTDPDRWRVRPSFRALKTWLDTVANGRFVERRDLGATASLFRFEAASGDEVCVAYSTRDGARVACPFQPARALDVEGRPLSVGGRSLTLSGRPVYLFPARRG